MSRISPELDAARLEIENWLAADFVIGLLLEDQNLAFSGCAELGVLAMTETRNYRSALAIMRFEIIDAALDFGIPFFDALELPIVGHTDRTASTLLRIGAASIRPSGTYSEEEIIEGLE